MRGNSSQRLQALRPGRCYIWTVRTDDSSDTGIASRLQAILSVDERKEARRFQRTIDQHQFVMARALVRLALSSHFPVPSDDWRFDRDRNGRPFIVAPALVPPVTFSVSHTRGVVACLITLSAEAAVDVERIEYHRDLELVAGQVLSQGELGALSVLSGNDWTSRFFDYWTLKEAYIKARGLGLSLSLSDIDFVLEPNDTIRARFSPKVDDSPSKWLFWRRRLSPQHALAVAVKRDFDNASGIILRSVTFDGTGIALDA